MIVAIEIVLLLLTAAFIYREVQQVTAIAKIQHELEDLAMEIETSAIDTLKEKELLMGKIEQQNKKSVS